jgi:hypothetical protein
MTNLNHDSRGLVSNPGPPEYEAGVLTARPRRSMLRCIEVRVHSRPWTSEQPFVSKRYFQCVDFDNIRM